MDGQGQQWGAKSRGHIIAFQSAPELQYAASEADSAYGDLLEGFRRYVVLLDSSFALIVDDVAADSLRRLEWLMHGAGQFSEDAAGVFHLTNDPASLDVQFLRPTKAENRVVSFAQNESSFAAAYKTSTQVNRYLSICPLHRQKKYRFIVLVISYRAESPPSYSANVEAESDTGLVLAINVNGRPFSLRVDLETNVVQLK